MTPDSDSYLHIVMNGALWYVVLLGVPTVRWLIQRSRDRKVQRDCLRCTATQRNLHVHRALHPNVRVLPNQRSTR